jgi:hypothetical protein
LLGAKLDLLYMVHFRKEAHSATINANARCAGGHDFENSGCFEKRAISAAAKRAGHG